MARRQMYRLAALPQRIVASCAIALRVRASAASAGHHRRPPVARYALLHMERYLARTDYVSVSMEKAVVRRATAMLIVYRSVGQSRDNVSPPDARHGALGLSPRIWLFPVCAADLARAWRESRGVAIACDCDMARSLGRCVRLLGLTTGILGCNRGGRASAA